MINVRNHSVRKNKGDNNNVLQCNDLTYLVLWKFIENLDPKKSSESISRSTVKGKKRIRKPHISGIGIEENCSHV